MKKTYKYARNGFFLVGFGFAAVNTIKQLVNKKPAEKFDWEQLIAAFLKGGVIGGGGGLIIGAGTDYFNSKETPINTAAALSAVVSDIRLDKTDGRYVTLKEKADWIIDVLKTEYGDKLKVTPFLFGSTEKGIALNDNFDIDICIPFKPRSFSSTADLAEDLFDTMKKYEGIHGIIKVRKQNKSVGLLFNISNREYKIDLFPVKTSYKDKDCTSGYFHVRGDFFNSGSRMKTDVSLQNNMQLTAVQEKLMLLLKKWKTAENIPINSHLLMYLVIDTYDYNRGLMNGNLTTKLIMVLRHIEQNIEVLRLTTIENTNNILTDISTNDKYAIRMACKRVIDEYEYQPNSILNHFDI